MSDENETRGIEVHTGSRIGYAHPSLSRDEVERLDRLRSEAGDRASAELVERALFDGDGEALAALGFHAVEVEPGDMHPGTLPGLIGTAARDPSLAVAPTPSVHGATYPGTLFDPAAAEAHDERMRAEGAARGLTTLDTMRAALHDYPDADFSAHRVRAEELLALDERRDSLAKSRRRWIDAFAPVLGDDGCSPDDVPARIEAYARRVRSEVWREVVSVIEARITSERITAERARDDERILAQHAAMGRADMCEDLAARFRARADEIERAR